MKLKKLPAIKVYYIYSAAIALFFSMVFSVSSIYHINMVHLNPLQLVLVGTALEITHFIFEIPTGIVADLYSRKSSIVIGLFLVGVGLFIEGAVPIFTAIIIAQVIWGFGDTFTSGADHAWIVDEMDGKEIDFIFVKSAQIGQFTALAGIFISMGLAIISPNIPIILTGILCVLLAVFLIIYMPETKFKPAAKEEKNSLVSMFSTFKEGIGLIKKHSLILIAVLAIGIEGLYSEGFDRLWTMRFLKDIPLPQVGYSDVFWLLIVNSAASILSILVIEIIKRKLENEGKLQLVWMLLMINVGKLCSIVFFALSGNFVLALISYCSCYTLRNAYYPLYDTWINKSIEESGIRATILSILGQINSIGQIAGGPVIGFIAVKTSVSLGIMITGLLVIPIIVLYTYVIGKRGMLS